MYNKNTMPSIQLKAYSGILKDKLNGERLITNKDLKLRNNYFENTNIDKLRIYIDIDGEVKLSEEEFNERNENIIKVLKSIDDISIISSSNYKSEKWIYDKIERKECLKEILQKLSFRITYINEYCENIDDMRNIVEYEKQIELKELFKKHNLSISIKNTELNIDMSVYRHNNGKIRCVNAYKHIQQKERINKLIKGNIKDTIISYIPDDCILKTFRKYNEIKKIDKIDKIDKIIESNENFYIKENKEEMGNKEILELVNIINIEYINDYNDWLKLIWSLKSENLEFEANILSKRSNKYKESDFLHYYNLFDKNKNKASIGTFYYYCKKSNEIEYFNIRRKYHNFNELDLMTDDDIANVFIKLFGENYIYYDKLIYYYNGLYWEKDEEEQLKRDISIKLKEFYLLEYQKRIKDNNKQDNKILKLLQKIGNYNTQDNIFKTILKYISKKVVEFECNPNLFIFTNKIYDLENNKWIERGNPSEMMFLNTTFDYIEPTKKEIEELEEIINNILPNKDVKKLYLNILYTGLVSNYLEKFNIANGGGGNGKGLLNNLFSSLSGQYSYNCSNGVLLEGIKQGNNQSLSLMSYKRSVFYKEPDTSEYKKLNLSTIKEITGEPKINAIAKYSIKSDCILRGTHILECNEKPKIAGKIDNSASRRIIDIPFVSKFVEKKEDLGGDNVYLGNVFYKTEEFKKKYRCALFKILLEYKTSFNINIPKMIEDRTRSYLNESDDLFNYFEENYEKKNGEENYIKCKDLYNSYKFSDIYTNFNKMQKKEFTYKNFLENNIKTNLNLKKYYVSRYRKNGKDITDVLIHYIKKNNVESDDDDDINKI